MNDTKIAIFRDIWEMTCHVKYEPHLNIMCITLKFFWQLFQKNIWKRYSYYMVIKSQIKSSYQYCSCHCYRVQLSTELKLKATYHLLLYSWKLFANSPRSHWLLRGHMTSNNETVSYQHLWAGKIAKSMMSQCNSALLPAKVVTDNRCQLQNFQLHNKPLKRLVSSRKQLILFPSAQCFPHQILRKQHWLFPSGPVSH